MHPNPGEVSVVGWGGGSMEGFVQPSELHVMLCSKSQMLRATAAFSVSQKTGTES